MIWEHSIQHLSTICSQYDKDFERFVELGKILDRYYIPTHYPDALARPAVPYKTYTEKDARDALVFAKEILKNVKKKIQEE